MRLTKCQVLHLKKKKTKRMKRKKQNASKETLKVKIKTADSFCKFRDILV